MKPITNFLHSAYETAFIEQLADDYKSKGYTVRKNVRIGSYIVDLTAEKNGETIYVEVKTRKETHEAKRRIREMADYFKTVPNAKFIVAISRFPKQKVIEIEDIDAIIFDYFTNELPSDLDALSTHTLVESIDDVSINNIYIDGPNLKVKCTGTVSTSLQYGSNSEQDDIPMDMSFPFEFEGTLRLMEDEYKIVECDALVIDTDAFYK